MNNSVDQDVSFLMKSVLGLGRKCENSDKMKHTARMWICRTEATGLNKSIKLEASIDLKEQVWVWSSGFTEEGSTRCGSNWVLQSECWMKLWDFSRFRQEGRGCGVTNYDVGLTPVKQEVHLQLPTDLWPVCVCFCSGWKRPDLSQTLSALDGQQSLVSWSHQRHKLPVSPISIQLVNTVSKDWTTTWIKKF